MTHTPASTTSTPDHPATTPKVDVRLTAEQTARLLRTDVLSGLTAEQKTLPPKWLYDARGSELFDEITRLPEYYPTRAEREILSVHAHRIAETTRAATLIELGSGFSDKTRLLLEALDRTRTLREFVPLDLSETALRETVAGTAAAFPHARVHGVVDDFTERLHVPHTGPTRLLAFLGGTIGNLLPGERATFLATVRKSLEPGDWLLLGTDLVKDPEVLVRAYDDSAGVTAEFNRNVLRVLNRELGADFPLEHFRHRAVWDPEREWIEMRLQAQQELRVDVPEIALTVGFAAGEELRTEVSAKFHRSGIEAELAAAEFAVQKWWTDRQQRFALSLATVA